MTYFPLTETPTRLARPAPRRSRPMCSRRVRPRPTAPPPSRPSSSRPFATQGFFGLRADPQHGGQGEGLLTTCVVTETLAKACPSTALIYKMHIESTRSSRGADARAGRRVQRRASRAANG